MRGWNYRLLRGAEFLWPVVALVFGVVWIGDAFINKVVDGELGIAAGEVALGAAAVWYANRGIRRALEPNIPTTLPAPPLLNTDQPLDYAAETTRVVRIAESRTPADCVTRVDLFDALRADDGAGIWTRWSLTNTMPTLTDDNASQVLAVLGSDDDAVVAVFTEQALSAVEAAERLARQCHMESVRPGHLAAALASSAGLELAAVGDLLRDYLGTEFPGFERVLRSNVWPAPRPGSEYGASTTRRVVGPAPQDRSAIGRWAYPVGACFVILGVAPMFARLPMLVGDSARLANAEAAIRGGELDEASALLDQFEERYGDSYRLYAARACIGAERGDDDVWAQNVQLALFAGMPYSLVGQCRSVDELGQFMLVRTGSGVLLRARRDDPTERVIVTSAATATVEDTVAEMIAASCDNGAAGYAILGGGQAFAALSLSDSLGIYAETSAAFAECVSEWPDGRPRDLVESWLEA